MSYVNACTFTLGNCQCYQLCSVITAALLRVCAIMLMMKPPAVQELNRDSAYHKYIYVSCILL